MIVIPMVGLSSRFFDVGYSEPKYKLPLWKSDVFTWVMRSFENYFMDEEFLFICRDDFNAQNFVAERARLMGITNFRIVTLSHNTKGQADTVYLGTSALSNNSEIFIFNIDTIRLNFVKPSWLSNCDGYLEVFNGEGDHWSFVKTDSDGLVCRTAEKVRISNFCSNGLYYFKRIGDFRSAFQAAVLADEHVKGEFYVAPLYNWLINHNKSIQMDLIPNDEIFFCGTPKEYKDLLAQAAPNLR